MPKYTGVSCPYCNQKFTEQDDIVVCPECGAPHHRECWETENKCHFDVLHSEDFEWKMPFEEKADSQEKTVICKQCGTENPENAISCSNCKAPISITNNDNNAQQGDPMFAFMDPLGGVPKDENIDGVRAEDLGSFIGDRAPYFVRMFYFFMKRNSKISFNFFACIFNGFWFLSKKMYGVGAAVCAATIGLFSVRMVIEYYLISTLGANFTIADIKSTTQLFAMSADGFLSIIQFVIMIICGVFANSIYMKHCTRIIKSVENSESKSAVFAKKGGTNMLAAVSVYACYMIISFFGYNLIELLFKLIK